MVAGMRTLPEIIKAAGGARQISAASNGALTPDAVYKWPVIGIPDRHWPMLMRLTKVSVDELFAANLAARQETQA